MVANKQDAEPENAALDSRQRHATAEFGRPGPIRSLNGKLSARIKGDSEHILHLIYFVRKTFAAARPPPQADGGLESMANTLVHLVSGEPRTDSGRLFSQSKTKWTEKRENQYKYAPFVYLFCAEFAVLLRTRKLIKTIWRDIPRRLLLRAFDCSVGVHGISGIEIESQRGKATGE